MNEELYTKDGADSFTQFQEDPSLFTAYHEGYRDQVTRWPENPLDHIINWIAAMPDSTVVGDFGCGDAKVAQTFVPKGRKVHSFDLVSVNELVTACNIGRVPLDTKSIDVAVFCLALMGNDWPYFVKEARRCLKESGELLIAEVKSRFMDVNSFVSAIERIGFKCTFQDDKSNDFFALFRFNVINRTKKIDPEVGKLLTPCIYKRR